MEQNKKWNYETIAAENEIHIIDAANPTVAIATIYSDPLGNEEYEIAKLICQAPTLSDQLTQLKEENERLKNDLTLTGILAMEFGYKQCEKGENIDAALLNYHKLSVQAKTEPTS